jgi:hypothetical protein
MELLSALYDGLAEREGLVTALAGLGWMFAIMGIICL